MKEYTYEIQHSWEKQRQMIVVDRQHRHHTHAHHAQHHNHNHNHQCQYSHHQRCCGKDDAALDADASSMSETTSESGVSDLETSMTDIRCTCCPYGYHLDTDFVKFLDEMYGSDALHALKKIERKRHDMRHRVINGQQSTQTVPVSSSARNSSSFDTEIIRETILELDRIVEKDIRDLETDCHRHIDTQGQGKSSGYVHQYRSRSVEPRRHFRPPPPPPRPTAPPSISCTAEERRLFEHRIQSEMTTTSARTQSVPRLNVTQGEKMSPLRKIDMTSSGPITMLYKIPPPPYSRSSSSSSLSTETTLRVSSPEPDDYPKEPLKPLYITEIIVPAKPTVQVQEPIKTTVITITDKTEIERRNREIERLELERKTLLSEKELLMKEIDRYKKQTAPPKVPERKTTSVMIRANHEEILQQQKPLTREVAMQHIVEEEISPPPLPPKQRQQRDVAINHRTEYDEDEEKQIQIVRRKLEEIQNYYNERVHILEAKILEQEKDIERLNEPKPQRHVNTQCQPTMQDRALVTDTFRSVRDVALTCHLQPTLPEPAVHRDVNLQCNPDDLVPKRDVCMETIPDIPTKRDVAIGVSLNIVPDKHFRDVGTHINFDYKPEICQRDVAIMFTPEPIEKHDRASNTLSIQTREFGIFANTIEPPKPPPKPFTRQAATDTHNLLIRKDAACGSNEARHSRDISIDTSSLFSVNDRASGLDLPPELLSRHVSTDTRTLISIRDNFSVTTPLTKTAHIDAQTQSIPVVRYDASSNTLAPVEQRHSSVQAVQEQPTLRQQTTATEFDLFHQLGYLRHNFSNTDSKRSTDRSTGTERQQLRDLAVNTEPKIMYSKNIGDYDVRFNNDQHEELSWYSVSTRPRTFECGFQTDLSDVKRQVGYTDHKILQDDDDNIEEQRQEIITFRLPLEHRTTTEEIYETTIITETKQNSHEIEEIKLKNRQDDTIETKITTNITNEVTKILENNEAESPRSVQQQRRRSYSPEELVEESYEVVSTLKRPRDGNFLVTAATPQSTLVQQCNATSPTKLQSSEDDSSYCEEWTVTEAKRKQDGLIIKTIIDRGGHHRYNVDVGNTFASLKQQQQQTQDFGTEARIQQHEEKSQSSPSKIDKTTIFEARRKLVSNEPAMDLQTDISDMSPRASRKTSSSEQQIEENYEVTVSTTYDETGLRIFNSKPMKLTSATGEEFELDEELYIACAIVNESLFDANTDKKKMSNCLQLIQQEWFRMCSPNEVNFRLIERFLNSIRENFSKSLLQHIINLRDAKGNTALHYCVMNGNWHAINFLLDTKVCDTCIQNNEGHTAVMMAVIFDIIDDDQRDSIHRLFRESSNLNVVTTDGKQTALMFAAKRGKVDFVELLLSNGAAINLQDSVDSTALMYAVEYGSLSIVRLLLAKPECDVEIVDKNGRTAISIAKNKNHQNILAELCAKVKGKNGNHSAFSKVSRAPNSLSVDDRTTENSSHQKATTETVSSKSQRNISSDSSSTVSTFRRRYSTK